MTEIEIYAEKKAGPALALDRPQDLEGEIKEYELLQQRDAALLLKLGGVVTACDDALARLRCARLIPFPLMTASEQQVWRAFLPTIYRTRQPGNTTQWGGIFEMQYYRFDIPPVSVLQQWSALQTKKIFDEYEIWTPERPMPEPILVGYRTFDARRVGPFLIARWGESLEPFESIREKVDALRRAPQLPVPVATQWTPQWNQPFTVAGSSFGWSSTFTGI